MPLLELEPLRRARSWSIRRATVLQDDAFAAPTDPRGPEGCCVLGHGHERDAGRREPGAQILEALPPVAPRLAEDLATLDREKIEGQEGERRAGLLPRLEDSEDALLTGGGAELAIEGRLLYRPRDL